MSNLGRKFPNRKRPDRVNPFWRFLAKFEIGADDLCWIWKGAKTPQGYGSFWCDGKHVLAHRWSYERFRGPILLEQIDHLCRNPACINPSHLEPVTRSENVKRGLVPAITRARQRAKTHCPNGHPYDGDNLFISWSGGRLCRECTRIQKRDYMRRQRITGASRGRAAA